MKKKIKVLQVIPRLGYGGAETGCYDLAHFLPERNYKSFIATSGGELLKFVNKKKVKKVYTNSKKLYKLEKIDISAICTPPAMHFQNILDAIKNNTHTIVEKPFLIKYKDFLIKDNIVYCEGEPSNKTDDDAFKIIIKKIN